MTDVRADVEAAILDPCVCGGRDNPDCERCVLVAVARAWLAANPADSDEPITPEWLASVGFDPADSFTHDLYPVRMELFADRSGEAIIGGVIFPHMNTRRDVRRLFAGLKMHLGG
jgi:hypothetical protein